MTIFVGTAGWTVPKQHGSLFPVPTEEVKTSHLERYASRLRCVEINSSFYRPHSRATWQRWAATTPDDFVFAVKAPKAITHTAKLMCAGDELIEFFDSVRGLGDKLRLVLVQLPPKLAFDDRVASDFLTVLRDVYLGPVALEPRHPSWFAPHLEPFLQSFEIARVAADPPAGSELAAQPGGWPGLVYWRLHGAPNIYYSDYDKHWLQTFATRRLSPEATSNAKQVWVIFDNTAIGHATANAVWLECALLGNHYETRGGNVIAPGSPDEIPDH